MAIIKKSALKEMSATQLAAKRDELSAELSAERAAMAGGAGKPNAGRLRTLRRTVARIATLLSQREAKTHTLKTSKSKAKTAAHPANPANASQSV